MAAEQDPKLQAFQLKEIQNELAGVEQRMQRLAILKKSIELQLIDPKDEQRFNTFLKKLSNVDVSNIESLRRFISGANDQFDELIRNNQNFATQTDDNLKTFISLNSQLAKFATRFSGANKTIKDTAKEVSELNSELEESNELADTFLKSFEEEYKKWNDLDKVQSEIIDNLKNMNSEQIDNIKNAFGLNSTYGEVSANIAEITSKLQNSKTNVSNMFQFDYGMIEGFVQNADAALSGIGQDVEIEIEGKQIKGDELFQYLRNLGDNIGPMISQSLEGHISTAKKVLVSELNETSDVIDAMIADLSAKLANPNAQILSPDMQGKVEAAWKKANDGIKDTIGNIVTATISMNGLNDNINHINSELDIFSAKTEQISKSMEPVNRYMEVQLNQLEYMTRNLMPNWLYQTLGLDSAFQNISKNMSEGLSNVAKNIAAGQSPMQALSGFAGSFTSSLLKSVGVIGLITIGVTALWKMMTAAGESVKELSKEFGVSRNTAHGMYKDILNITAAVGNTSIKQEDVLEVLKKHRDQYGLIMDLNNKANQESVKFAAQLGKQYGIGAGEAYGFTQQLQQLGADQKASEEIAAVAAHASDLAGIPFSTITKDLAESAEFVGTQFAGYPLKAVEAATKIRAMGGSLKQVEKAMDKAFDTKNFLQGMTELNMMTGGVVDLSEMFRKSMAGDEVGVYEEVAKQYDKMVAAGQTNMFQMKQFAAATGISVEELQKGHKLRKMEAELGADTVKLLGSKLDKLSEADLKDAKAALAAEKKLNASEKMDTILASLKDTLMQALLPLLEGMSTIISGLAPALKLVGALIKGMVAPFTLVYELISSIFNLFTGNTKEAKDNVKSMGDILKSTFLDFSSTLSGIGSILASIVALWSGIKLIGSIGKIGTMIKGMSSNTLSMFNSLKGMVTGPLSKVSSIASSVMAPGGMMSGMIPGGGMMSGMMGKAGTAASNVMGKASSAVSNIAGKVGGAGNLMKIGGGITAGAVGGISAYKKQKEKGGTDSEAAGAAMIQGGLAASGAVLGTALGGPLGGMIGGFLGDTVGGWLVDNAPGLVKKAGEMWDKLSEKFAKLAETWQPIIEKVLGAISGIIEKVFGAISAIFSKIADVVSFVVDGLDSFANMLGFDGIGGMIGDVLLYPLNLLMTALGNLVDMFTMVGQLLSGDFSGAWDTFTGMIGNSLDAVFSLMPSFDGLATMLGDVLLYPVNILVAAFENLVDMFTMAGQLLTGDFTGAWDTFTGMIGNSLDALIPDWVWSSDDSKGSDSKNQAEASMLKESVAQTDKLDKLNKASNATVDELSKANELSKAANSTLKGLTDDEKMQLKNAGYSDDIIKKLDEGNLSIEGAMKENLSGANLNDDQISKLANPATTPKERDAIMTSSVMGTPPSLEVGTSLVKSDGLAMLHKGESVIPAEVVKGGYLKGMANDVMPDMSIESQIKKGFNIPNNLNPTNNKVTPVKNELQDMSEAGKQNDMYMTQAASPAQTTSKPATNQDAILKQLLTVMQDVANRPVQVQIGGVELKSLNNKMKVYNNKF